MHDKGGDLGSSNCPTGRVVLSSDRHGIKGLSGKQGQAIYTAFLRVIARHIKVYKPTPFVQVQLQKLIICMSELACKEDT